jgi:hypothetical protein
MLVSVFYHDSKLAYSPHTSAVKPFSPMKAFLPGLLFHDGWQIELIPVAYSLIH